MIQKSFPTQLLRTVIRLIALSQWLGSAVSIDAASMPQTPEADWQCLEPDCQVALKLNSRGPIGAHAKSTFRELFVGSREAALRETLTKAGIISTVSVTAETVTAHPITHTGTLHLPEGYIFSTQSHPRHEEFASLDYNCQACALLTGAAIKDLKVLEQEQRNPDATVDYLIDHNAFVLTAPRAEIPYSKYKLQQEVPNKTYETIKAAALAEAKQKARENAEKSGKSSPEELTAAESLAEAEFSFRPPQRFATPAELTTIYHSYLPPLEQMQPGDVVEFHNTKAGLAKVHFVTVLAPIHGCLLVFETYERERTAAGFDLFAYDTNERDITLKPGVLTPACALLPPDTLTAHSEYWAEKRGDYTPKFDGPPDLFVYIRLHN